MILKAHGKTFRDMHLQWHALDAEAAFTNTNDVSYPDTEAVNATGAQATDGTEFVKKMIDNYMFGRQQALLNLAGLTPDGNSEADGASQEIEALYRILGGGPGCTVMYDIVDDPAVSGVRVILNHGQGVLRTNYPDMDAAVYCGDADNATADFFYHADNSDGTSRNTAGAYLIMRDARGLSPQGAGQNGVQLKADGNPVDGGDQWSYIDDQFQGWQIGGTNGSDYYGKITSADQSNAEQVNAGFGAVRFNTGFQGDSEMITAFNNGADGDPRSGDQTNGPRFNTRFATIY